MDVIGKVRRLKLRDKLSTSAIARATGLSRNTVKKWLTHHCHILETGNESYRFRHSSTEAKGKIKSRESQRKVDAGKSEVQKVQVERF